MKFFSLILISSVYSIKDCTVYQRQLLKWGRAHKTLTIDQKLKCFTMMYILYTSGTFAIQYTLPDMGLLTTDPNLLVVLTLS